MSYGIRVTDGTVGVPTVAFENDTDSGFYRIGVNNVGLALGGAKVVDYSATGIAVTGTFSASGATTLAALTTSGVIRANANIKFPATQVPDGDANTLDDYEEGTFTPTLTFGGASTGNAYAVQAGRYEKIGRTVHIGIDILLSTKGSATGNALIAGLPFTPVTGFRWGAAVGFYELMSSISGTVMGYVNGAASINLVNGSATTTASLTDANFNNNSRIMLALTYSV